MQADIAWECRKSASFKIQGLTSSGSGWRGGKIKQFKVGMMDRVCKAKVKAEEEMGREWVG